MTSEPPIRVLIVEDDPTFRAEFARTVANEAGLVLVGAAADAGQARACMGSGQPLDVAIVDLGLPDGDGNDLIRALAAPVGRTAVLVASVFGDEWHVVRALEAGAQGYLLKDGTPEDLVRAIRTVHAGGAPLSPAVARHLLKRFGPASEAPPRAGEQTAERLTAREAQILGSIAQGCTAGETAARLHLSVHTVNTHVKNIYSKLGASNRLQAVNLARASGQIR
jgi:DNA-binding NarL/FixJ family response regulator